jgi:hypothetical protein
MCDKKSALRERFFCLPGDGTGNLNWAARCANQLKFFLGLKSKQRALFAESSLS